MRVVDAIASAAKNKRAVVVMLGGHIVKTGLSPLLIDLMDRRVITHLAMNGSAAIHDYEIARFGATSEDVARGLVDGTFGMAEETGRGMNQAFTIGMKSGWGMGEALARALKDLPLVNGELSVLLAAYRLGIPCTVHAAIGAEIIHQHPAAVAGDRQRFDRTPRRQTAARGAIALDDLIDAEGHRRRRSRRGNARRGGGQCQQSAGQ